jgi:pimeloyl-ACP methyl ester carboxylesterase
VPEPRPGKLPASRLYPARSGALEALIAGKGEPSILLFNGAGVTLQGWRGLFPRIEQIGTVLGWNRYGTGRSDRPREPQTGRLVVDCLRDLLEETGVQAPYVLVGHSLGGLHANLFARLFPREVRAVLLLEATHPRDSEMLRGHEGQLAAVLGKLFALPQRLFRANLHAEMAELDETVRQVDAAGPFPAVPLVVISGGKPPPRWLMPPAAWQQRQAHQRELAGLSPLGEQVMAAHSGHFPQRSEPQVVLDALQRLAVATPGPAQAPAQAPALATAFSNA